MATIMHLPDELIAIILKNKSIGIKDILSFKSTCKRLVQITLSNEFWKEKYCQRCSTAGKRYRKLKRTFNHLNMEGQIKSGIQCIKKLQHYVLLISYRNFPETDREQLNCLLHFIVENSIVYYFVLDELNRIISVGLLQPISQELFWKADSNLVTIKCYCKLIFLCLKRYRFLYKQFKFLNKPKEKQIVERQLLIVAQYFVPHVSYSIINAWLDGITQEVLSCLKHKYPMHSIFSIPSEQFSFWRDNNISENFWNPTEALQIIRTVEEYIFSLDLEIHKLYEIWMILNREEINSRVLAELYDRIVLIIITHIVTRRLGVEDCNLAMHSNVIVIHFQECYSHDGKQLVIWRPKYKINWDVEKYLRMREDSGFTCVLHINEDTHKDIHVFIMTSDNTSFEKKINICIDFKKLDSIYRFHIR